MNNKKVLIISHNPINTTDNMGKTIGNIFSKFKSEELCQLYFRNQNVQSKNCENFFCIDDISMVKSVFNRFYKTGRTVENNTIVSAGQKENKEEIFQYGRKRTGKIYIFRNLLWSIGKWNTKDLKKWLNKMKPTTIFFVAGDYNFAFKIAMKISKKYNIPLNIYFTDEFYRKNLGENTISNKIAKNMYRKIFKKTINKCINYFTITDNMLELYEKEFGKNGYVLMNTTEIKDSKPINLNSTKQIKLKYIGNLGYNRWKNIIEIGKIIDEVNKKTNNKYQLEVYSGERNPEVLKQLQENLGEKYKGSISSEEVMQKIEEADILIHTESFETENKEKVMYSLSTKIPDSLASKRILLAYGPEEIASIKYIKKNNVGIIANSKEELEKVLLQMAKGEINFDNILKNASDLVEKNHRINSIHKMLHETIMEEK